MKPESFSDSKIDQLLGEVPVPEGLVARLQQARDPRNAQLSDAQLDLALADVDLPPQLISRLQTISGYLSDEEIDQSLKNLPTPSFQFLRPASGSASGKLKYLAIAASVLLLVTWSVLLGNRLLKQSPVAQELASELAPELAQHSSPEHKASPGAAGQVSEVESADTLSGSLANVPGSQRSLQERMNDSGRAAAERQLDQLIEQGWAGPYADPSLFDSGLSDVAVSNPSGVPSLADQSLELETQPFLPTEFLPSQFLPFGNSEAADALATSWPDLLIDQYEEDFSPQPSMFDPETVLGADGSFEELVAFDAAQALVLRGATPPRIRQFDHLFLQRHGVHPYVDPSAHESLRRVQVPLLADSAGYDRLRLALATQGPIRQPVAVEEVVAAFDYLYPPVTGQALGIRTAAGPSVFTGSRNIQLLQVGIQAGAIDHALRQPTYLTIGVDVSGSMHSAGKLQMVQRALTQFVEQLGPQDRISLISFGSRAEVLFENGGREHKNSLLAAISALNSEGATSLGEGIRLALSASQQSERPVDAVARVLVLTDGLTAFSDRDQHNLVALAEESASASTQLHFVSLSNSLVLNSQLQTIATAGLGKVNHVESSHQIKRSLLQTLTGDSLLRARQATLAVQFNPEAVVSYRLIGHEAHAGAGLLPGVVSTDLYAEEAATGLFEVVLKPNGPSEVATVSVAWQGADDPAKAGQLTQKISRLQFAKSLDESPLSLQMAMVTSEIGQLLRQSYFTQSNQRSLDQVVAVSQRMHPRLQADRSFQEAVAVARLARTHRVRTP